jgi:hypothetical protein
MWADTSIYGTHTGLAISFQRPLTHSFHEPQKESRSSCFVAKLVAIKFSVSHFGMFEPLQDADEAYQLRRTWYGASGICIDLWRSESTWSCARRTILRDGNTPLTRYAPFSKPSAERIAQTFEHLEFFTHPEPVRWSLQAYDGPEWVLSASQNGRSMERFFQTFDEPLRAHFRHLRSLMLKVRPALLRWPRWVSVRSLA